VSPEADEHHGEAFAAAVSDVRSAGKKRRRHRRRRKPGVADGANEIFEPPA